MIKCVNISIVEGYATADARYGQGKVTYNKINLRTTREFFKTGETTPTVYTVYHNVAAFGNRADELKDIKEGDFVRVIGRAESRKYTNKDGVTSRIHEIIVEDSNGVIPATLLSGSTPAPTPAPTTAPAPEVTPVETSAGPPADPAVETTADDDENPFKTDKDNLPF